MTFTRREFSDLRAKQSLTAAKRAEPAAQQVLRAEIAVANVTGDPDWDVLLTMIQATIEDAKSAKAAHERAALDPATVEPTEMMRHKTAALLMQERINVLSYVVAIPSEIKREGDKARTLLARLKEADGGNAAA